MTFIPKHTSVISTDRTTLTIKNANSESDFLNNGMTYPPVMEVHDLDEGIIITSSLRTTNQVVKVEWVNQMFTDYFANGVVVNITDLTDWDATIFSDDVYQVEFIINYEQNNSSAEFISESTNVVMADSEQKYFENVLAYQRSQNYNPISSARYDYLHLDSLYKSLKYAEQLNLIPSCVKLLNTFKKALL